MKSAKDIVDDYLDEEAAFFMYNKTVLTRPIIAHKLLEVIVQTQREALLHAAQLVMKTIYDHHPNGAIDEAYGNGRISAANLIRAEAEIGRAHV